MTEQTLTKADLIEQVHERSGLSKKQALDVVELLFETVKNVLETGEKVKISGFGCFSSRRKKSRIGRNPKTGEEMTIQARSVLTFRPSPVFRAKLNRSLLQKGKTDDSQTQVG